MKIVDASAVECYSIILIIKNDRKLRILFHFIAIDILFKIILYFLKGQNYPRANVSVTWR